MLGPINFRLNRELLLGKVLRSTRAQQIHCQRPSHLLELTINAARFVAIGP